jgi:hypothetical protein
MTKVLIVAKTIMGSRAGIGALAYDTCQPVRVLAADGGNFSLETEFQMGQLWEMELVPENRYNLRISKMHGYSGGGYLGSNRTYTIS